MSRLRIALVAHGIHFRGGMERCFAELAGALSRDHDVHLFADNIDDVPLERLTVHRIAAAKRPVIARFAQFYVRSSRAIRLTDFDIVHTIGAITARQNVVTAQFCQLAWGDVLSREAQAIGGITPYHRFMWRMAGGFERRVYASAETLAVSANSEMTGRHLTQYYGCEPSKIEVIYNGVDPARFCPDNRAMRASVLQQMGAPTDKVIVLFAGEYRRKGLATAIRALARLGDPRLHLIAVGRGDRDKYGAMAKQLGVAEQVTLGKPTGRIEQVYGAADVFVFPTYYEPFGMVITEAMASGLPVITTTRAGAAEFIKGGISGLLVDDPADADAFAENIQLLAAEPEMRRVIGMRGREAVQSYDWQVVADKTAALYRRVASESRSPRSALAEPT